MARLQKRISSAFTNYSPIFIVSMAEHFHGIPLFIDAILKIPINTIF